MSTTVKLGGVPVAAVGNVVWAMTTGVAPYMATFDVHREQWDAIESMMRTPQSLVITGINGRVVVEDVFPLHEVQSDSKNRRRFLCADRRWMWAYRVVIKDYNVTRKTGDRALLLENESVPVEVGRFVDRYRYMTYSIQNEERRWKGRTLIEDVLSKIEDKYEIRSVAVEAEGEEGQVSIQNLLLRDEGDKAMARALRHVPGTEVTVRFDGVAEVFDGTDLRETDDLAKMLLGDVSWMGDYPRLIDKSAIRPNVVYVYFVREVEIRFDYQENYGGTISPPGPDQPFITNVLPLPDPITRGVRIRDEDGVVREVDAPQGTWVPIPEALRVWEQQRQDAIDAGGDAGEFAKGILPYTFDTIRKFFVAGNLEAVWGATGADISEQGSAEARAGAIKQHLRRTFQVNKKYMERIREIRSVRAALLDPVTGTRAPALAWGEHCVNPSLKGWIVTNRYNPEFQSIYINRDPYPGFNGELDDEDNPPSPADVQILDGKLGVFHIQYAVGPYGYQSAYFPSQLADENGELKVPTRNLALQDETPVAVGARVEGVNTIFLSNEFNIAVVVTAIPNAPNDKRQMHRVAITQGDIPDIFVDEFGIQNGVGPNKEVFVPPSVCTARFGWQTTDDARATISDLLGVEADDAPGFDDPDDMIMSGYLFVNGRDEIPANAKAAAAEVLVPYADTWMGDARTGPREDAALRGTMSGVSHEVDSSPGGRFTTRHGFSGMQRQIDRFALLPDTVRHITLGIIPYQTDGSK